MKWKFCNTWKQ